MTDHRSGSRGAILDLNLLIFRGAELLHCEEALAAYVGILTSEVGAGCSSVLSAV